MKYKTFILETTTNDRWEMATGVCIIVAENEDEAKKLLRETGEYPNGKIFNVIEVDVKTKKLVFEQTPTVE